MSERKINLEEILENHIDLNDLPVVHSIVSAMKEACKQVIELAAENAKGEVLPMTETGVIKYSKVNKQSILDTINQIE